MSADLDRVRANETEEDKTKWVINALESPKYTWRTLEAVGRELGLPLSEVQEIMSKLGRQVIKSSVPAPRGRDLYTTRKHYNEKNYGKKDAGLEVFITRTDQAIDQLSEAKPGEIQKIAAPQIELIREYHLLALKQANQSFRWALIAAAVGVGFFLGAIGFLLTTQPQGLAIVSVISGAIVEGISGLNFYLYGQATKQLAHYHRQLDQTQRFLLANSVCESLEGESRQKARSDLVSMIVTFGVEQLYTFTSEE